MKTPPASGPIKPVISRADITASEISVQSHSRLSDLLATQTSDRRTAFSDSTSRFWRVWISSPASSLYRLLAVLRSVRRRIWHQFATATKRVDLGPSLAFQDGYYAANKRTQARAEGIKRLLANHMWADSLDLRIFLEGFDAGEEYRNGQPFHQPGNRESTSVQKNM